MKIINFDHNASTQVTADVLKCMNDAYSFGANSSSTHSLGRKAAMMIECVREDLKDELNAQNYDVYFTSGGTEANNMALFSDDFEKIFYAKFEHSSVYNVRPRGAQIIDIRVDENGVIDLKDLEEKLNHNPCRNFLVSIMQANNETGAIQPIKEAAMLVHQKGGLFHTDMVQTFGKFKIDLEDLNADFASISSHKVNGPQGVGALLVRRGLDIRPLIYGGGHESGKRSGTMNNAGIAGFGQSLKIFEKKFANSSYLEQLRDLLEEKLQEFGAENVMIYSKNVARVPNTSYFALRNTDSQTQLIHFDLKGFMISAGSACSSGTTKASRVLQAMNANPEFSNAIRVSFGFENTKEEVLEFVEALKEYYQKLGK